MQVEQKRGERSRVLSFELLALAGEKIGYQAIPFTALQAASSRIARTDDCEAIQRVVKGLHDSRPEEFCEFFAADLERFARFLSDAKARGTKGVDQMAMKLFGGLDAECEDWYHELVRLLQANEKTRTRANTALKNISYHLPANQGLLDKMQALIDKGQ